MRRRQWLRNVFGVAFAAAMALTTVNSQAQNPVLRDAAAGKPNLKSIDAIGFAPDGVLLIGDGKGKQIVAVDTGDATPVKWAKTEINDIRSVLAGRLGAAGKDIEIKKVAINRASQTAYFAVRLMTTKKDMILTLDGSGKVKELALDNVKFAAAPLPADQGVNSVTGVAWAGDRILVTGLSTGTFVNKCFSIMAPLGGEGACTSFATETFHVAHDKWETNAPIRTMMPYEENGKHYLIGTFTCTPIVKYGIDDLKAGERVKGTSVIELGMGNTPQYMFTYDKGGKKYILMNSQRMGQMQKSNPIGPSEYWTAKVDFNILTETTKVNKTAIWRSGSKNAKANVNATPERANVVATFHGVTHMGQLDNERALVIRKDGNNVNLQVLALP